MPMRHTIIQNCVIAMVYARWFSFSAKKAAIKHLHMVSHTCLFHTGRCVQNGRYHLP